MTVYASENFAELPGNHHGASSNTSETEPAQAGAVFIVDTDETGPVSLRSRGGRYALRLPDFAVSKLNPAEGFLPWWQELPRGDKLMRTRLTSRGGVCSSAR